MPVMSAIYAPSKAPIVTSKSFCFFVHTLLLWKRTLFLHAFIIDSCSSSIFVYCFANCNALSSKSFVIDG